MRLSIFVCVLELLGVVLSVPTFEAPDGYYHETIGIKAAARIKAAEEATDFDGARIIGGSPATLGQYPYFGGLVVFLPDGLNSVCGSSLLSNTRLVTAAHCWQDGKVQALQFVVVLGSLKVFSGGTRIVTKNVRVHENWDPKRNLNDVAMITIDRVAYSNTIRNIALPTGSLLNNDFINWIGQAVGFGAQRDDLPISPHQTLHHTALRVLSNSECVRHFGSTIVASHLCTDGSDKRSICGGDSGGPLQVSHGGSIVLIGITSFGHTRCEQGYPGVFARVTTYNNWIRSHL